METASLAKNEMMGYLQEGWKGRLPQVHRPSLSILTDDRLKKWAVPRYMYKHRRFPKFLSGSGYFVEKNDAKCLLDVSQVRSVPLINVTDIKQHTLRTGGSHCAFGRCLHDGTVCSCLQHPKDFSSWIQG